MSSTRAGNAGTPTEFIDIADSWKAGPGWTEVSEKTVTERGIFFFSALGVLNITLTLARYYPFLARGYIIFIPRVTRGKTEWRSGPRLTSMQHYGKRRVALRNLLRSGGSVLLQRITRLATSLAPSLMPRAPCRGSAVIKLTSNGNIRLSPCRVARRV